MSAVNVRRLSVLNPHLLSTREYTLEKGLRSAVNVGNSLATSATSVDITEVTLLKSIKVQ